LVNTGSPDLEKEWQWRILSFETEWRLPLPLLTDWQTPKHGDSKGGGQGWGRVRESVTEVKKLLE